MNSPTQHKSESDLKLVAAIASAMSLGSILFYFQRGQILLYGDAVAHINIARRVFDSQTPGLLQLGTVWLPLPHLLTLPFIFSDWMWQTGLGGSIPSMIAYVLGVIGIFRLTRDLFTNHERTRSVAGSAAWFAALIYAANPNLLYLQATAMTEPLYLALFIWAAVYFAAFLRLSADESIQANQYKRSLYRCALCLAGAELTRYDGWFLGAVVGTSMLVLLRRRWQDRKFRATAFKFLLAIAVAPILWLGYNAAVYGNALEFANGPYSAKAIERKTAQPGYPAHPGAGNVITAGSFFLKSAQLNMAEGNWGRIWILIALAGAYAATQLRVRLLFLLLAVPLVFYALSIAYSGVPLFLPTWWPFTWYNLRYGVQLLPLFAISGAFVAFDVLPGVVRAIAAGKHWQALPGPVTVLVILALSYFSVWHTQPLCFTEAWVNSRTKLALESSVSRSIAMLPRDARYLMYIGDHVGAFQQAGVPLRQVINEGNHRPWKRPSDPDGLWELALADPSRHVDFVIAYEGDAVDQAVNRAGLTLYKEIHASGQPSARIYAVGKVLNQSR
ncbi:MAG: hypothetical protein HY010_08630 [Acidobacteria bacterium]|nr:hypothetical protein [Acidobacteriota bacterium]